VINTVAPWICTEWEPTGTSSFEVIAIFGPTGVGKTEVALALAGSLRAAGGEPVAVSADALQVYAGLETLTGVASAAERRMLEHRLVAFVALQESFSAGRYAKLAHAEIDRLLGEGKRPIVVGGTGLYLRAALAELDLHPPPAKGARERWSAEVARRGPEALHRELAKRAPESAASIGPHDRQRLVRALELLDSGAGAKARSEPSQLWTEEMRRPTLLVGLTMSRDELYARIDARVERILAAGAREEVLRADAAGASVTARKALGFAELLAGDLEAMKRHSRNYARRQLTWMRKLAGVHLIDLSQRSPEEAAGEIARLAGADRCERS
jgi:tRNA dimethylallyltransferase